MRKVKDIRSKKGQIPWNKGKRFSEESKLKMSQAHLGKIPWNKGKTGIYSKDVLERNRQTHLGKSSWNKGVPMKESSSKKLSESLKGHLPWNKGLKTGKPAWNRGISPSAETREKLSKTLKGKVPWIKGKHHTEEAKEKERKAHLGKHFSPRTEFKKGQIAWNKGIPPSQETKKKISVSKKGHKLGLQTEQHKRNISLASIGKPGTNLGKKFSEPHKQKIREYILKQYESGIFPARTNTKPERDVKAELVKRGYVEGRDFVHQYKFMDKFMCDFCFPNQKIIVEVHGDFWHANPNKYPEESKLHPHQIKGLKRDKAKEAYIKKVDNGSWTYLVLWESDIKENLTKCVDKIEEILKKKKQTTAPNFNY